MNKNLIILGICLMLSNFSFSQTNYENYTYQLSSSTNDISLWTTTPANKVLKTEDVPDESGSSIKVYAAKNEFEPFILVINPSESVDLKVDIGTFSSNINTELNIVKYTYLDEATDALGATGYFPDALEPVELGETISLTADENTVLWFTVEVDENTTGAKDYAANITLGDIEVPVTLHVFDFNISDDLHVKSQMNFSHSSIISKYGVSGTGDNYWKYVDLIKQYFIDHRLTPKAVLWSGGLTTSGAEPYIDYDCSGTLTDNDGIWGFEAPAERYLNGTGTMNGQFSSTFNDGTGFPSFMCATFKTNDPSTDQRPDTFCEESRSGTWSNASSTYNTKWFTYITAMESYLKSNSLLDKAYYYFANEPANQDDYDAIAWYSQKLKKAAPDLKLMVSEEPKSEIYNNSTYSDAKIDIWLPVLHNYDPDTSWARETNYDEETWIYFLHGTTPPYFNPITLDHQGVESKFTGWFLWKYRIKGIAYYSLTGWSQNPWTDPMTYNQNGNTFLLYPPSESNGTIDYGANNHRIVPSIRLELLRDGLEDYEYLYTLAGGQPEVNVSTAADTQVDKIISGLTSYTRDAEFMYNLRRLIGLKNGGEISSIPDIEPEAGHWRTQETPGNYYINFQDPDGSPATTSTETIEDQTYSYYTINSKKYLQIGTNNYDEDLGYGWYASDDVNWMMKYDEWFENTNDLEKSYIYSDYGRTATFEFDLPSGNYDVTVSIGKRGSYSNQNVSVESVTFFENTVTSSECKTATKNITVSDSKLSLVMGDGTDYTFLNYMEIEAKTTALNEVTKQQDFYVYPNPANDYLYVKCQLNNANSHLKISLLDITGKEVMILENKKTSELNFEKRYTLNQQIEPGIYFLRVNNEDMTITKKIIIE